MRDRLIRGALAGVIAGLWIVLVNNGSFYVLHFGKALWVEPISQLMWGHPVRSPVEWVLALFIFFVLVGAMGYLYAWKIVPEPVTGNYLLRGLGYGLILYVILLSSGTYFRVPKLSYFRWETTITNLVAVTGWGLILGWLTRHWDYALNRSDA